MIIIVFFFQLLMLGDGTYPSIYPSPFDVTSPHSPKTSVNLLFPNAFVGQRNATSRRDELKV